MPGILCGQQMNSLLCSAATFNRGVAEKVSFVVLQGLDVLLTLYAVSIGLSELNPLISSSLNSPIQFILLKVLSPILIAWLVPGKLLIPAIVFIALVVCWDLKELLVFLMV